MFFTPSGRSLNGKITTFDAPGVGTGYNQGTQPQDIYPRE